MVDLTVAIIDPYYIDMRAKSKENKSFWHKAWVKRLDEYHLHFAAKEVYTCYEMFRRIVDMRRCFLPEDDKGSSHKESGGDKHHRK
ncbi:hypothetical protein D1007_59198 [Hordeum vulgare]|nr:hypothetical protein D1007_59198 [Hordeum vulgare]